jgi:hypothetical protein
LYLKKFKNFNNKSTLKKNFDFLKKTKINKLTEKKIEKKIEKKTKLSKLKINKLRNDGVQVNTIIHNNNKIVFNLLKKSRTCPELGLNQ